MVGGEGLGGMAKHYIGDADPKHPLASPIHADYKGVAPLLIQVGDAETLLDDSNRVAARAKSHGVKGRSREVWDDMVHVWHVFAKILPEGQQAIDKIGKFVLAHTSQVARIALAEARCALGCRGRRAGIAWELPRVAA